MHVTETSSEGLKRKLKVVVGADELGARFSSHLDRIKDRVQLKGFRKGKVPVAHIKKVFGRSVMSEVLEETIQETSSKALAERKERPAMMPEIALPQEAAELERVLAGQADLAYEMSFEVLPEVRLADFKSFKLERLVTEVDAAALDEALARLAEGSLTFVPEEGRRAEQGDRVTIDYEGTIDGKPFERGKGEDLSLVLGKANYLPGFEQGLEGAVKGERRTVKGTFPAEYALAALAGKEALFDVTVKEVAKPVVPEINDEFAKSLGAEGLEKLKSMVAAGLKKEYEAASRLKLKRELLDALERAHDFELPPSLVERELEEMWRQASEARKRAGKTLAEEGKTEEELRAEYRQIAQRRVRLGLVVGEIGARNSIEVTQEELRRALIEQAHRFPGQERRVYEYFEKTPGALRQLEAPIFEEKVVDFVLNLAEPAERKVTRDELVKRVEEITGA
jgi:trigger factor